MIPKILVFIITYKASHRVLDVVKKIPFGYLKKYNYQILISDDNSNDNITIKYINLVKSKFGSKVKLNFNKKNLGYGGNIKKCILYGFRKKFDYAVMVHGDNQYNPKYIIKMLKLIINSKKYAAISGSRMLNKSMALKGKMPLYKYIGNIVLTKIFNFLFNTKFTDCHTGYWAYDLKKVNKKYFINSDNKFCFDIDLRLQLINDMKYISEIPIKTFYGTERSSVHIIYAIRFFLKILKFKIFKTL